VLKKKRDAEDEVERMKLAKRVKIAERQAEVEAQAAAAAATKETAKKNKEIKAAATAATAVKNKKTGKTGRYGDGGAPRNSRADEYDRQRVRSEREKHSVEELKREVEELRAIVGRPPAAEVPVKHSAPPPALAYHYQTGFPTPSGWGPAADYAAGLVTPGQGMEMVPQVVQKNEVDEQAVWKAAETLVRALMDLQKADAEKMTNLVALGGEHGPSSVYIKAYKLMNIK
jgi:hypothetical protein